GRPLNRANLASSRVKRGNRSSPSAEPPSPPCASDQKRERKCSVIAKSHRSWRGSSCWSRCGPATSTANSASVVGRQSGLGKNRPSSSRTPELIRRRCDQAHAGSIENRGAVAIRQPSSSGTGESPGNAVPCCRGVREWHSIPGRRTEGAPDPTQATRIGRYPRDSSTTGTIGSHAGGGGGGGGTRPCSTLSRTTSSKACRFRRQNRVSVETKVPFSKYLLTGAPPPHMA